MGKLHDYKKFITESVSVNNREKISLGGYDMWLDRDNSVIYDSENSKNGITFDVAGEGDNIYIFSNELNKKEKSELVKILLSENTNQNPIKEDVSNKGSKTSMRLVEVDYDGKKMKAIAVGYASGPYFKEVYYTLNDVPFENSDFDNVEVIDPSKLV